MNDLSPIFYFEKRLYITAQKWDKFGENLSNRFRQNPRKLSIFQLSHFDDVTKATWRWRHKNFLPICNDFYL